MLVLWGNWSPYSDLSCETSQACLPVALHDASPWKGPKSPYLTTLATVTRKDYSCICYYRLRGLQLLCRCCIRYSTPITPMLQETGVYRPFSRWFWSKVWASNSRDYTYSLPCSLWSSGTPSFRCDCFSNVPYNLGATLAKSPQPSYRLGLWTSLLHIRLLSSTMFSRKDL